MPRDDYHGQWDPKKDPDWYDHWNREEDARAEREINGLPVEPRESKKPKKDDGDYYPTSQPHRLGKSSFSEVNVGNKWAVVETFKEYFKGKVEWRALVNIRVSQAGKSGRATFWVNCPTEWQAIQAMVNKLLKAGFGK